MTTKKDSTVKVAPSKVKFFDTTLGKSIKTAIFLGISAVITSLVNALADPLPLLGNEAYDTLATFILINIVLVAVKNLLDPDVKNY